MKHLSAICFDIVVVGVITTSIRIEEDLKARVAVAAERIGEIVQAVQILASSPLIGRPVKGRLRELVIGRASLGYAALYRYVPDIDTVFVLAMRHRRESRYGR